MKRTIIGSVATAVGGFCAVGVCSIAGNNLVDVWDKPPLTNIGRFNSTLLEYNLILPLVIFIVLFFCGVVALGIEYFKK